MSWYGTHPVRSKEWVAEHFGRKLCKDCVYFARVHGYRRVCFGCSAGPSEWPTVRVTLADIEADPIAILKRATIAQASKAWDDRLIRLGGRS